MFVGVDIEWECAITLFECNPLEEKYTVVSENVKLIAPDGKFRVVLVDNIPMTDEEDHYHIGDFDTLDDAKARCTDPDYGTSYIVFDDGGNTVYENRGRQPRTITIHG